MARFVSITINEQPNLIVNLDYVKVILDNLSGSTIYFTPEGHFKQIDSTMKAVEILSLPAL